MRTLGQFYRDEILSLPSEERTLVALPANRGEARAVKDLFGWKVFSGRNVIECRSEEEARYLAIFLDAGLREVYVPNDDETLGRILPQLESLKAKTDEILQSYLASILDRKVRERLRREVFEEITK